MPVRGGTAYRRRVSRSPALLLRALPWPSRGAAGRAAWSSALAAASRERVALVIVLAAAAVARVPTLGVPLDEFAHPFRQTQTAYVALLFQQRGIDLFHAQLPVLGPPWEVPLELPLFQAIASLVMGAGVPTDLALRLTALTFFFLTAVLLWSLVRRIASPLAAMAALILFVTCPFGLVWSRAELIEYLATAASLAWLLTGMRWRDGAGARWWWLGLLFGSVALLVKVTTGALWILPLLAYRPERETAAARGPTRGRAGRWTALAGLLLIPFAAGAAWTVYADSVKAGAPLTAWLMSSQLTTWNFGTLAQRLDPEAWLTILSRAGTEFGGPLAALFVVGLAICVRTRRQRLLWVAIAATATLPIVVFFNLYWIHDYYLAAISPGIAMIQGLLLAYLLAPLTRPLARRTAVTAVAAFVVLSMLASQSAFWGFAYATPGDPDFTLAEAAEVAANSAPSDLVLTEGRDWSPAVLYVARRRGLAVPTWLGEQGRTDLIDPSLYRVASFFDPTTGHLELLAPWPLVGVTGQRTYAMGAQLRDLRAARLLAAAAGALALPPDRRLTAMDLTLPCDGALHGVPLGTSGAWLELAPAPPTARLMVGARLAALPARSIVVIGGDVIAAIAATGLACRGATELRIERIWEAPLPTGG